MRKLFNACIALGLLFALMCCGTEDFLAIVVFGAISIGLFIIGLGGKEIGR